MAHGYIDDGYGIDGGRDRDRDERDRRTRDHDREHGWRDRDEGDRGWRGGEDWRERGRDRGMMFEGRGSSDEDRWSDRSSRSERALSAHPDDHYRSWRDRHMSELDRDYADYCREREQRFHSDFDAWRQQRHASYQPLRTGMTNSGLSHDPSGEVQQTTEGTPPESDAMSAATLGTNDAPQTGRTRR